ncbi:helix-turn-helix domain-containing protein [Kitasatospora sp. NPDC057500]|uniref:helix-turn-helix domain-containing protein n=1 Tax=Kitasatospora sp. NPDC057500 TaxID=3346151 RepID=UPI0036942D93
MTLLDGPLTVARGTLPDGGSWQTAQAGRCRGYRLHLRGGRRRLEVPTDVVTVVIGLSEPLRLTDAIDDRAVLRAVSPVGGLRRTATVAEHQGRLEGVSVSLHPADAHRLFGPVLGEAEHSWADLPDLLGRPARRLAERLAEQTDWARRFRLLGDFLTVRIDQGPRWPAEVSWAFAELRRTGGTAPVRDLVQGTGWSRRRLETRFREAVGLAPKQAAQVVRLQRALSHHQSGAGGFAETAAVSGFYDQAHLSNTFRATTGCSPAEFFGHRASAEPAAEPADRVPNLVTSAVLPQSG